MTFILDLLFGCRHKRLAFPRGKAPRCHQTCLECGAQLAYDWRAMRLEGKVEATGELVEEVR